MKRYKCHKIVEAGEIASGNETAFVMTDGESVALTKDDAERIANMMVKSAAPGGLGIGIGGYPNLGYLVRYEDGYLSWSPKAVFEAGYAEIAG